MNISTETKWWWVRFHTWHFCLLIAAHCYDIHKHTCIPAHVHIHTYKKHLKEQEKWLLYHVVHYYASYQYYQDHFNITHCHSNVFSFTRMQGIFLSSILGSFHSDSCSCRLSSPPRSSRRLVKLITGRWKFMVRVIKSDKDKQRRIKQNRNTVIGGQWTKNLSRKMYILSLDKLWVV